MTVADIELPVALEKLARTLEIETAEVEFLADLDVDTLRQLRWRIEDRLAAAHRRRLAGVVNASKLVPVGLAATIGEQWFGAVLCARLVGLLDAKRGAQYARHLSVDFMADITARTDPRIVGDLVHELDVDIMRGIATTLVNRDDHLSLSHFVGHIPPTVVADILLAIDDNAAVVRIARYVEDLAHLDPIVALLPDDRIVALVQAVAADDLWVDGFHLFAQLGDEQVNRIGTTIVHQDPDTVRAALDAFDRHDLWEQGLRLVEHLDEADTARFADALRPIVDDLPADRIAVLTEVATALGRLDLLQSVLDL